MVPILVKLEKEDSASCSIQHGKWLKFGKILKLCAYRVMLGTAKQTSIGKAITSSYTEMRCNATLRGELGRVWGIVTA